MNSEENPPWSALRLSSPAGTWYIARSPSVKRALEAKSGSAPRAVFSRGELHAALPAIRSMSEEERRQWLKQMIYIKKSISDSRIEIVKFNNAASIRNRKVRR